VQEKEQVKLAQTASLLISENNEALKVRRSYGRETQNNCLCMEIDVNLTWIMYGFDVAYMYGFVTEELLRQCTSSSCFYICSRSLKNAQTGNRTGIFLA
jgi:hypothetical protein